MHEHRNDEIFSYMWRGTMLHEDRAGNRVALSAHRLLMMNAGVSFWHEESVPDDPVEMLQIFIRPGDADLPPKVDFYERPEGASTGAWALVAGPEGSDAPLTVRNAVYVHDVQLPKDRTIKVPTIPGFSPWLYVLHGLVEVGEEHVSKSDAVSDRKEPLPPVRALSDAMLVLFLVDLNAPASLAGKMCGG